MQVTLSSTTSVRATQSSLGIFVLQSSQKDVTYTCHAKPATNGPLNNRNTMLANPLGIISRQHKQRNRKRRLYLSGLPSVDMPEILGVRIVESPSSSPPCLLQRLFFLDDIFSLSIAQSDFQFSMLWVNSGSASSGTNS